MKAAAFILLVIALFGAVASSQDQPRLSEAAQGYQALADKDLRVATVGYHLARASAPFCKLKSANPGWVLHDISQYGDTDAAREVFEFRQPVSIAAVVAEGSAERAGLSGGDGLVGRNGTRWIWGASDKRMSAERVEAVRSELDRLLLAEGGVTLEVASDNGTRTIQLRPEPICKSDFWVDVRKKRDAGADGDRVRVTSGLIDYVLDDDELAAVIAHELSHNILAHRTRINAARSGKTGIIKATEEEADRLSVWLMANAGYDPQAAVTFWERYGEETGLGIFTAPTHYRWQSRVAMLREEIEKLQAIAPKNGLRDPPLLAAQRIIP